MQDVFTIAAKTLHGGVLVLVFAALSETLEPERPAGILGAAPSVAIVALRRLGTAKGPAVSGVAWVVVAAGLYPVVSCCPPTSSRTTTASSSIPAAFGRWTGSRPGSYSPA